MKLLYTKYENRQLKHSNIPWYTSFFIYITSFICIISKKSSLSYTVYVYSREVPVHVQKQYLFCQFSKEDTDTDIHRTRCSSLIIHVSVFLEFDGLKASARRLKVYKAISYKTFKYIFNIPPGRVLFLWFEQFSCLNIGDLYPEVYDFWVKYTFIGYW